MTDSHRFCASPIPPAKTAEDLKRLKGKKAAFLRSTTWDVGSEVTIRFLEGDPSLRARVQAAAEEWTRLANLTFDFRNSGPTDIRIAFAQGKGSWSYIGKQCRDIAEPNPTMNFGWLTPESTEDEIRSVVMHEFGHAIGMIHEHQNPKGGGINWNRPAVIADLSGPPNNWDEATIDENMFKKYDEDTLDATAVDALSIMMYPIPLSWTNDGTSAGFNSRLSQTDEEFVASEYPR